MALLLCSVVMSGAQTPKYIFLFIGDGMGFNHVETTQLYCEGGNAESGIKSLLFPTFPVTTQVCTRSASHLITCSSAAATALACGQKTANYVIGMEADKQEGLTSLARQLKAKGYKIGIVTSASIDHATPGGFYASQPDRGMYYEIGVDAANSGFDFFGGAGLLEPRSKKNPDAPYLYDVFKEKGYSMYRGMETYNQGHAKDKILLFPIDTVSPSLKYAMDRSDSDLGLPEITKACLDNMQSTASKGFFMMVEGGKIDWAAHAHDAATVVKETMDFDHCIRMAYEFYKKHPNETLILVTADHETGGLALGNGSMNLNIGLLKNQQCSLEVLTQAMKEMKKSAKTPAWEEVKIFLKKNLGLWEQVPVSAREELDLLICYENSFLKKNAKEVVSLYAKDEPLAVAAVALLNTKAGLGWSSKTHTGTPVPLYVIGKQANLYSGRRDNTDMANVLRKLFDLSY